MGAGSVILLTLMLVVVVTAGAPESVEGTKEESCISWNCARKRVLQLSKEDSSEENEDRSLDSDKSCISWNCRREMMLRNRFLDAQRAAADAEPEVKKSSEVDADETPCISGPCRRKKREAQRLSKLQTQVDKDPACLTKDCRTGKRSLKKRSDKENTALMEKLRFVASSKEKLDDPGCIAWHCNAGKRR